MSRNNLRAIAVGMCIGVLMLLTMAISPTFDTFDSLLFSTNNFKISIKSGSINSNLFDSATRALLGGGGGGGGFSSAGSASIDVATNGSLYTFTLDASQTNAWNAAAANAANAATNNLSLWNALYDALGRGTQVTNSLAMWNALYDSLGAWKLSTNGNGNAATFLNGVGGYTTPSSGSVSNYPTLAAGSMTSSNSLVATNVSFGGTVTFAAPVGPAIGQVLAFQTTGGLLAPTNASGGTASATNVPQAQIVYTNLIPLPPSSNNTWNAVFVLDSNGTTGFGTPVAWPTIFTNLYGPPGGGKWGQVRIDAQGGRKAWDIVPTEATTIGQYVTGGGTNTFIYISLGGNDISPEVSNVVATAFNWRVEPASPTEIACPTRSTLAWDSTASLETRKNSLVTTNRRGFYDYAILTNNWDWDIL